MTMFTHRHYEAIAAVVVSQDSYGEEAIGELIDKLADMFKRDNSQFNRKRFLAACGR